MTKRKPDEGQAPRVPNPHAEALGKHAHEVRRERDPEGYTEHQKRASAAGARARAKRTPEQKAATKAKTQATWRAKLNPPDEGYW